MTDVHDRSRTQEDDYFRKRDLELIEKMRERTRAAESAAAMSAASGLTDPALVGELQSLGFSPETLGLLPLVPVIQMAWAEGGVTADELKLVKQLAAARGIAEDSPAGRQLAAWLKDRPSDVVFAGASRLIRAMLSAGSSSVANITADDLVEYCEKIASASGGVFGLGKVSGEERALLANIAGALKERS